MNYLEIQIGALYESTDLLGIALRSWNRNEPVPNQINGNFPILRNNDLFVVLEVVDVIRYDEVYDVKVLTTKGDIGWLFLWKQYEFPANIVEIPEAV